MQNNYTTVFTRIPFEVSNPAVIERLHLLQNYDDAFVAYLNGTEIARSNFSGTPTSSSTANSNHEIGAYESFFLDNPADLLQQGTNIMAFVGLNVSLSSSDFSLSVRVESVSSDSQYLYFYGVADVLRTHSVRVNGTPVQYTAWSGEWSCSVLLEQPKTTFLVEALDEDGNVIESDTIIHQTDSTPDETLDLEPLTVWTEEDSPVLLSRHLVVPPTYTLTIEPGVVVQSRAGNAIIVQGTIAVLGNSENPVRFEAAESGSFWGGIAIDQAAGHAHIQYASFSRTRSFDYQGRNYNGAVYVRNSTATVQHCYFTNMDSGVNSTNYF